MICAKRELDQRAYNARQRTLLPLGEVSTLTTVLNRAARRFALGFALGVAVLAVGVPAGGAELLRPSDAVLGVEMRERLEADPFAMRWRVAGMESAAVFEPGAWGRPLALELFPDARVRARVRSAKTLPSGSRWLAGTLEGGGHFTLLRSAGGILRGEFHSARGVFTIRSQGAGRVLVEQRDVAKMRDLHHHHHDHGHHHDAMPEQPPDKEPRQRPAARPKGLPAVSPRAATDDEDDSQPVDILVVYTQRVEDYEGGPDEVIVTLENEIARMNQVLENSGLNSRRVRGIFEKVDYEQAEHIGWDSSNLRLTEADNDEDGDYSALDEVFPLIEKHQADLVHLFVRDALRACGAGGVYYGNVDYWVRKYCESSDDVELCLYNRRRREWRDYGRFGVTAVKCISNYTFPHELGHNLGVFHDRGAYNFGSREHFDRSGPFKNYAFGYQNFDFLETSGFCQATVMSAGYSCRREEVSRGSIRTPYFSNPDLFFPRPPARYDSSSFKTDTPMGVPGDERTIDPDGPVNASRAIDEVWHLVAALSEPDADRLPGAVCRAGDLAADALAGLPPSLVFAPGAGARRFALPLSGPAGCVAAAAPRARAVSQRVGAAARPWRLSPWPAAAAFQVSVEQPAGERREHRLSFAAERHWGPCSATSRAAAVVDLVEPVNWEGRIAEQPTGVRPAGIALERGSAHAFCAGAPAKHLRRLGDFDGDGRADALLRHADGHWRYHPLDGGRVLPGAGDGQLTGNPSVAVAGVGDFDGDGRDDVLMRRGSGSWYYYAMNGRRSVAGSGEAALPADRRWRVAGVGDFDRDGKDDVLLRRLDGQWDGETGESWRYHLMDGRAVRGAGRPAGLRAEHPVATWVAGVGDFDGDGRDDALLRRLDGTWHYYPFHLDAGLFAGAGAVALPGDLAWGVAGVADFNGDGRDGVLLRHADGRWRHERMDGRLALPGGGVGDLPADAAVWTAGVGDMDGDGKAEVLTRRGHGAWGYYGLDGNGAFAYRGEVDLAGESAWGVLSGGVAAPPRASAAIGVHLLAAGADATLDLSEHFADGSALVFEAASSDAEVARVRVAGGVLTLTGGADGRATVTVTARDADGHVVRQTFLVVVGRGGVRACEVPLFLAASSEGRQGFVRLVNRSDDAGAVVVTPVDDAGVVGGHVTVSVGAGQTVHFNSEDLENGNPNKAWLSGGAGAPSQGDWRLCMETDLALEALAYARTSDGFLTTLHETVGAAGKHHEVAFFNPGGNAAQASRLRLVNASAAEAAVTIVGTDDNGVLGRGVALTLAADAARTVGAAELEAGAAGLSGMLGDGAGKWRLRVSSDRDIQAMSLLDAPGGNLTNLSTTAPGGGIPLFPRDAHPDGLQGFARVVNRADRDAVVTIHAIGDDGARAGPVFLSLGAGAARHFNSRDLALGNAAKGLAGGVGASAVDWRLELGANVPIQPLAYIRTPDGFVTSMHDLAPLVGGAREVVMFNPASNRNQASRLRIINPGAEDAAVTIAGVDDNGAGGAASVSLTVPAGQAATLTARDLEEGVSEDGTVALAGMLGDGAGKWRLRVSSDQPVQVMSLLASPTGNLTNLSSRRTGPAAGEGGAAGGGFRDCAECPEMVAVPAGSFMMGAPEEEEGSSGAERPVHRVDIAAPFAIGVHEVTFAQWDACVAAGGCEPPRTHNVRADRPVTDVSWHDAQGYVEWLSAHTNETYRLPSEAEWEYAARAGTRTPFHFGETISTDQANYDGTTAYGDGDVGENRAEMLPVGSFPANAWGLRDVHGNAAEWTQDCRSGSYDGAPADGGAWEEGDCAYRVTRGGSWPSPPEWVRSAARLPVRADWRNTEGIRVVRELGD